MQLRQRRELHTKFLNGANERLIAASGASQWAAKPNSAPVIVKRNERRGGQSA
jgi:hypothetical protein